MYVYMCEYMRLKNCRPCRPERRVIVPDRPVKLNWDLFRITRKHTAAVQVEQEAAVAAEIASPPGVEPTPSVAPPRRIPAKDGPLAYCADCRSWQPMRWRPAEERGRKVETWFACAVCGCERLTVRYLPG